MKSTNPAFLAALVVLSAHLYAAEEPASITLSSASGWLPGIPILVRVELRNLDGSLARQLWDAEADLTATPAGAMPTPGKVTLWNGVGSALVSLQGAGDITITAARGALQSQRTIRSLEGAPMTNVSGNIPGPVTEWSGIIHVTGSITVPAGVTLRALPGTLVLLDGVQTAEGQAGECQNPTATPTKCGQTITVRGTLESMGTSDEPVVFTAAVAARAWGEIHHDDAAASFYENTFITRAGNSPRGGHTNTGPAIRATDSTILFAGCSIADTAGKSMQATGSDLEFHDCLLTRSIMGPEIDGTALIFERSYSLELYGSDDNDGIYLHSQRAGQMISLTGCIVASGDDDGIDTLGSDVTIEDCIVRDFANPGEDSKGISVFSGDVTVTKCLVAANKVGISAKSQNGGTATVHIERSTIVDCTEVGMQAEDKFGEPDLRIRYFVTSSIIRSPDAVKTDYPQFPDDIQIQFSDVSEAWSGTGNIMDDPLFASDAASDYHLTDASPCIDAGEASLPPDADGSPADMGVYPFVHTGEPRFVRGSVNADGAIDISDAITVLLHLFKGTAIDCGDAADTNDDGALNVTDAVFLLEYLFQGGPDLPEPRVTCGEDSTADALDCSSGQCG